MQQGELSGGTAAVKSSRTCIVYDESGRVHHVHRVVTLEGGREPSEAQIEADALNILKRHGKPVEKMKMLHLPSDKVPMHELLAVDPGTKRLNSQPRK